MIVLADSRVFRLCFAGRQAIESPITCPVCHASNNRRSKRRSLLDHLLGFTGVLPWRCETCETRFHARLTPLRNFLFAHCRICGNLELVRISPDHVPGVTSIAWRLLGIPALRCEPCRNKFFSVRPLKREEPAVAVTPSE